MIFQKSALKPIRNWKLSGISSLSQQTSRSREYKRLITLLGTKLIPKRRSLGTQLLGSKIWLGCSKRSWWAILIWISSRYLEWEAPRKAQLKCKFHFSKRRAKSLKTVRAQPRNLLKYKRTTWVTLSGNLRQMILNLTQTCFWWMKLRCSYRTISTLCKIIQIWMTIRKVLSKHSKIIMTRL